MKYAISFLIALSFISTASAAELTILTPTIRQGQSIIASFDVQPTSVTLDGKTLTAFSYQSSYRIVSPTTRTITLGSHILSACFPSADSLGACISKNTSVSVTPAFKKTIVLPVPKKLNQTPAQVVQNLSTSNTATAKTTSVVSDQTYFTSGFGLPLKDNRRVSSPFGEVRQTTATDSAGSPQVEKINHNGTDFVGPKGSAVAAINSGVIASAYLDPIYGNTVIVNHGRGIFSVYMHLNSIKVKQGEKVNKGKIIGTLGETGLASGPHLHLSIKINGISVDPLQFVNSFK